MRSNIGPTLFILGLIWVAAALVASCLAPCSWFAGAPMKDVPARCLGELIGGSQ
jgi:hypothetical protein